ncbi:hypothetical protein HDU82_003128 [Entophlyctis luteolus]|nr:hypothetical protein HDU82_003128 [Entophlyctis luteolus]
MKFMYVLLAAKVPLDCANIAVLTDLMPADVQLVISKLHSLLLVFPDGKVTVLHKSVKDFLTSPVRCNIPSFYVSLVKANVFIAQHCLAVLNDQLRHNIFQLSSASEPVEPKQQELLSTLPPAVRYSCLHWNTHILDAAHLDGHEVDQWLSGTEAVLSEFCAKKILQWLEVMAVEKKLGKIIETCTALVKIIESALVSKPMGTTKNQRIATSTAAQGKVLEPNANNWRKPSETLTLGLECKLLSDIARIATRFHPALDFNPLHVYQSALTFTPHDTKLYQLYHSFAGGKVTASPDLTWGPLVSCLSGHTGAVTSVAYNCDGSLIASGSEDKTVRVWNPLSGALVSELKGHSHSVTSVAFNHDGSLIASGSWDNTVRVWNPLSGALVSELKGHSHYVNSVAFNHDGFFIASGSADKTVRVWNTLSGALVSELKGHSHYVNSVAFNHDGSLIASGSADNTVRVWNPFSGALVSELNGHSRSVTSVAFNHNGSLIASGSADNTVRVWNPLSGALVSELKGHSNYVCSVAFNHDGFLIASGSRDKTVRVWNPLCGALVSELKGHSYSVTSVAFNHDGSRIASRSRDNTVKVWNPLSGDLVSEFQGHSYSVTPVAFNCDGPQIASRSRDNTITVWTPPSGALISGKAFAFNDSMELLSNTSFVPCLHFSDSSGWIGLGPASAKFLWVPLAPSLEYAFSHSAFACGFPDGKILICSMLA